MSSLLSISERTVPRQSRASRRLESILDTAEKVFAASGYEAATMTAIAEQSATSIGGLYRYFPDKESVARALIQRYVQEVDSFWASFIPEARHLSIEGLAERLVVRMEEFTRERPGYVPLLAAPVKFVRDAASRRNLRVQLSKAFRAKKLSLAPERALLTASVVLQILKAMVAMYAEGTEKDHARINAEFRRVLECYLSSVLG